MHCDQCGESVPDEARFCPSCGTELARNEASGEGAPSVDDTTASIDIGQFDPHHEVSELPDLTPGTGMLVVVRGPNAGSRFLLDRDETTIGRHSDAEILLDDVTVSRRHATLRRTETSIVMHDNGSLNGSYVNGDRVDERALASGDEVQIGRFKFLFVGGGGIAS